MDFVPPDNQDEVRERLASLPEDNFENEYRIIRPDGEMRWLHARGGKVIDE